MLNAQKCNHYQIPDGFDDLLLVGQDKVDIDNPSKTYAKRNVPSMRKLYEQWRSSNNAGRKKLEARHGLKPRLTAGGLYLENPFYKLYDLYQFDIHEDMAVDYFHVDIIGLYPAHVDLFHKSLPAYLKDIFKEEYSKTTLYNRKLKPFDEKEYWMGEVRILTMQFLTIRNG